MKEFSKVCNENAIWNIFYKTCKTVQFGKINEECVLHVFIFLPKTTKLLSFIKSLIKMHKSIYFITKDIKLKNLLKLVKKRPKKIYFIAKRYKIAQIFQMNDENGYILLQMTEN